jgi:hypothetical protein
MTGAYANAQVEDDASGPVGRDPRGVLTSGARFRLVVAISLSTDRFHEGAR